MDARWVGRRREHDPPNHHHRTHHRRPVHEHGRDGVSGNGGHPHHRGVTTHHVAKTHRHARRHVKVKVRHRAGVTRAVVHNDPIAVTALGVHHTGDPVAFAATAR